MARRMPPRSQGGSRGSSGDVSASHGDGECRAPGHGAAARARGRGGSLPSCRQSPSCTTHGRWRGGRGSEREGTPQRPEVLGAERSAALQPVLGTEDVLRPRPPASRRLPGTAANVSEPQFLIRSSGVPFHRANPEARETAFRPGARSEAASLQDPGKSRQFWGVSSRGPYRCAFSKPGTK